MDRKRIEIQGEEKELKRKIKEKERKQLRKRKGTFVDDFLEITNGVDVWRHLYPDSGGFTYQNDRGSIFSRIDYFLCALSSTRW